jgi:hypothetical protein
VAGLSCFAQGGQAAAGRVPETQALLEDASSRRRTGFLRRGKVHLNWSGWPRCRAEPLQSPRQREPAWYDALNDTPGRAGPPIEPPPADVVTYFREWLENDGYPFWSHRSAHLGRLLSGLPVTLSRCSRDPHRCRWVNLECRPPCRAGSIGRDRTSASCTLSPRAPGHQRR